MLCFSTCKFSERWAKSKGKDKVFINASMSLLQRKNKIGCCLDCFPRCNKNRVVILFFGSKILCCL